MSARVIAEWARRNETQAASCRCARNSQLLRVRKGRHRPRRGGAQRGVRLLAFDGLRVDDVHPRLEGAHDQIGVQLVRFSGEGGTHQGDGFAHRDDGVGVHDDHPRPRVGDHPRQLTGRRPRVDGDGDDLRAQDAEVRRDELDPVAHHDHRALAGHQARCPETGRDPGDLLLERRPGDAAAISLHHGEDLRTFERRLRHERGDVVRRHAGHDRTTSTARSGYLDRVDPCLRTRAASR